MRISKYVCNYKFNNNTYLFNTLNKSILQIDSITEQKLTSNLTDLTTTDIETFRELEYLVDDKYNEKDSALKRLSIINKRNQKLQLTILVTNNCNCNCFYCYEKEMFSKGNIFNMFSELDEFLKNASTFYNEEINLSFHGGEPTLYPETMLTIYYIVKKYYNTVSSSVVTNGTLCSNFEVFSAFKIIKPKTVLITIDGLQETHDFRRPLKSGKSSFHKIIDGIIKLKDINIIPHVSIILDKNNLSELNQWYKLINDLSISSFYISRMVSGEKNALTSCLTLKEFSRIVDEFYIINKIPSRKDTIHSINNEFFTPMLCSAKSKKSIIIDPNGNIYNCISMTGKIKYSVGNISQNYVDMIPYLSECNTLIDEKCLECKYLPLCYGGCMLEKHTDKTNGGCLFHHFERKLPQAIKNYILLKNS